MNIDEILKTWKEFEKLTEQKYQSVFGDEFKLKMPSTGDKLKLDLPKEPAQAPAKLAIKPEPVLPKEPTPDWKSDIKADMAEPRGKISDAERLARRKEISDLPVKVSDYESRVKGKERLKFQYADDPIDYDTGKITKKGRISRRFKSLKDTGFRFKDFYNAIDNPEMKDIRKILGREDRRFGRRHGKAMKAYVNKIGTFEASRNLGVDELTLKKMFLPKNKRNDPNLKNWARNEGGMLAVPNKFIKRATKLGVKYGAITPEQAKNLIRGGMNYDPRTGYSNYGGELGDELPGIGTDNLALNAVARLAARYAARGYNASKHRDRTGHDFHAAAPQVVSAQIKYLKSRIKAGKASAMKAPPGGDYKGKYKRDYNVARQLMKDYGSLTAYLRSEREYGSTARESLPPRVRKMFSKMSLDQTLGNRALEIAKNPKYTLDQLVDMRKNRSGPEGLKTSSKLRRRQALLDRAIALRQGAATGQRRVKLPGGLIDFDSKGILTK